MTEIQNIILSQAKQTESKDDIFKLIKDIYYLSDPQLIHFGTLHIVFEDSNIDDNSIDFCLKKSKEENNKINIAICILLKKLTLEERDELFIQFNDEQLWAYLNHYVPMNNKDDDIAEIDSIKVTPKIRHIVKTIKKNIEEGIKKLENINKSLDKDFNDITTTIFSLVGNNNPFTIDNFKSNISYNDLKENGTSSTDYLNKLETKVNKKVWEDTGCFRVRIYEIFECSEKLIMCICVVKTR